MSEDTSSDNGTVWTDESTFDPLFGQIVDVHYGVSNDDEAYAIVIEQVENVRVTLVYDVEPGRGLLWVFRSIDSSVWGDTMWQDNEDVIDVAEGLDDDVNMLLVTEEAFHRRVLKLLIYDDDVSEWRADLVLYVVLSGSEGGSASDSVDGSSIMSSAEGEPPLSDDSVA